MKKLILMFVSCIAFISFSTFVVAGDQHEVSGVVKKIKTGDKKITISHGPIKSLGMDGMTMDFGVYDPAMLDEVEEGHKVSFVIEVEGSNFTIMEIEDKGAAD